MLQPPASMNALLHAVVVGSEGVPPPHEVYKPN